MSLNGSAHAGGQLRKAEPNGLLQAVRPGMESAVVVHLDETPIVRDQGESATVKINDTEEAVVPGYRRIGPQGQITVRKIGGHEAVVGGQEHQSVVHKSHRGEAGVQRKAVLPDGQVRG